MDVRIRFRLLHPIFLEDCWALEGYGALLEFEREGDEAKTVVVTFRNQPIILAPRVTRMSEGPIKAKINVHGGLEALARQIIRRLSAYINLYFFRFDVEADHAEVQYVPASEEERAQMSLYAFKSSVLVPRNQIPFSLMAQAFFAGEGSDDPSFASHLVKRAREALIAKDYIDAFRYSFLLFEALYGGGKFKATQLVSQLTSQTEFRAMVETSMASFVSDPIHRRSRARDVVARYPTANEMIKHLVTKRGLYFHANIARSDAWHPERQEDAKELAEISVEIAGAVAHSLSSAMFTPEIGSRYLENAKKQGAIVPVHVKYNFIDHDGHDRSGQIVIKGPGTKVTNSIAIEAQKSFLEWFKMELPGSQLVSAEAHDKETGMEVFRSEYQTNRVSPDQAASSD